MSSKSGRDTIHGSPASPGESLPSLPKITVSKNGEQVGPITREETNARLRAGELNPNDWAWLEGAPDWVPLGSISGIGGNPPPQPVPAQQASIVAPESAHTASVSNMRSFGRWYWARLGRQSRGVQMLAWLCGGYVWIPLWWAFSKTAHPNVPAAVPAPGNGVSLPIFNKIAIAFIGLLIVVGLLPQKKDGASAQVPKATQAEANAFLGLTQAALIQRLGQPISVEKHSSPDGSFKMIQFDRTKGIETFFTIFAADGRVNFGYYRGVPTKSRLP